MPLGFADLDRMGLITALVNLLALCPPLLAVTDELGRLLPASAYSLLRAVMIRTVACPNELTELSRRLMIPNQFSTVSRHLQALLDLFPALGETVGLQLQQTSVCCSCREESADTDTQVLHPVFAFHQRNHSPSKMQHLLDSNLRSESQLSCSRCQWSLTPHTTWITNIRTRGHHLLIETAGPTVDIADITHIKVHDTPATLVAFVRQIGDQYVCDAVTSLSWLRFRNNQVEQIHESHQTFDGGLLFLYELQKETSWSLSMTVSNSAVQLDSALTGTASDRGASPENENPSVLFREDHAGNNSQVGSPIRMPSPPDFGNGEGYALPEEHETDDHEDMPDHSQPLSDFHKCKYDTCVTSVVID
jgi:hypothetical protein